ncbi:bifunctional epoxide hydrolase 2-like [Triticum dicoccoides]|uniref:bifunctional epoxide hydrolase 2-like n=1 Tax=Triticum dicoccoides TaxID=85692 RepID=UPI00188EF04E|nr:bifunctional epoxide hydrolase 2-like [Triticum dicoccoides]
MLTLLSLRPPPPAVANILPSAAAAQSRPPLLRARRTAGPPPPSAAAAEFPAGSVPGSGTQMPPRRRRLVAGIDQDELLDPDALADPDSSFYEFNGVRVHHKVCAHGEDEDSGGQSSGSAVARSQAGLPIVLLHGFGASVFSWSRVMRPLARIAGAKVLAFDRPAFGLTSRTRRSGDDTKPLNPYSMAFSAMATLAFIDQFGPGKAVLVGHSAGCLVAVEAYFEAPERVVALVLVAPAIFAPRKGEKENSVGEQEGADKKDSDDNNAAPNPFARIWRGFLGMCMWLAGLVLKLVMAVQDTVRALSSKLLVAFLRSSLAASLVRLIMDKFGVTGVRNAWYDPSKVTDHVIQGYTKPLRSKGWETALLEYTISMITDSSPKSRVPVSKRLSEISCPVLVVTGDTDRLVPASNAERLARAIPGAAFEVIKNCGHLPQEERAEEFLSVVERFLQRAFGTPDEHVFQAAV